MALLMVSDNDLLQKAKLLAQDERKIQVEFLWHLLEIQKRKLFLELGFPSLYEYVVKELGYSHGAAYRRIQAMRLLQSVPAVAEKLEEGKINLCTAAQVQGFIKAEKKSGEDISFKERVKMVEGIENKSTREVEKHLISLKPENMIKAEKIRVLTPEFVEIRLMISETLREKLDALKSRLSHVNPDMTYLRLIEYLAERALVTFNKKDVRGVRYLEVSENQNDSKLTVESAVEIKGTVKGDEESFSERSGRIGDKVQRNIPSVIRHAVWMRDKGRCAFLNPITGRRCSSNVHLQVDHIIPWSLGGENTLENLQLLCGQHNRQKGVRTTYPIVAAGHEMRE